MPKDHEQWLRSELPKLVREDVLSEAAAERLRQYYAGPESATSSRWLIAIGIVAALSMGAGVILLAAYNWPFLSRPVRAAIALVPLIAAQGAASFALPGGSASGLWREVSATFLVLAVGLALSLVGQTYHAAATPAEYGLWWLLLALPVVYLLRSRAACILYLAGTCAWGLSALDSRGPEAILWWPLAAAVVPYIWWDAWQELHGAPQVVVRWTAAAALGVGCVITAIWGSAPDIVPLVLQAVAAAGVYLVGTLWLDGRENPLRTPLRTLGAAALGGNIIFFSFAGPYSNLGRGADLALSGLSAGWLGLMLAAVAATLALVVQATRKGRYGAAALGILPLALWLTFELALPNHGRGAAAWCMTGYGAAAAIVIVWDGVRRVRFYTLNAGLLLLIALMGFKFFSTDLSLVTRGVAFTALGAALFGLNYVLSRKMREGEER